MDQSGVKLRVNGPNHQKMTLTLKVKRYARSEDSGFHHVPSYTTHISTLSPQTW